MNAPLDTNRDGRITAGNSTGPHVHIEAAPWVIDRWVNDLLDGRFDGRNRWCAHGRRRPCASETHRPAERTTDGWRET